MHLQVRAVSTTKHANTSDEDTVDFSGSSGKPAALLTKELMVVHQSPVCCCFLHLLHLPFIPPCLQRPWVPSATPKAFCEQPLRRCPLPTAAQTRSLRIKPSTHVINSDSHNYFLSRLTTCFPFGRAVPSSSCKKLQAVKSLCIVPSASGKDLLELRSLPNV